MEIVDQARSGLKTHKHDKVVMTESQIRAVTDMARENSAAGACRKWNAQNPDCKVTERTVQRYKAHFNEHATYFTTGKRGPKNILTEIEDRLLNTTFDQIRAACAPVCSRVFASVARGIVARTRPEVVLQERVLLFSLSWAKEQMKRCGIRRRAATTDRTVSAKQIKKDGIGFYRSLRESGCAYSALVFNMDEFFLTLGSDGTKWTWARIRQGERANIPIAPNRAGYTCSVLSAADGSLHLVQMIYKGKTNAVHAVPEGVAHPKIFQDHNPNTHFQTEKTFKVWLTKFKDIVSAVRIRDGLPAGERATLILDAATQHITRDAGLEEHGVTLVCVPKKQTHCFQPADMFIISGLKQQVQRAWSRHIQEMYAGNDATTATSMMIDTRLKIRRDRKYKYMAEAIDALTPEVVVKSWAVTGILRAMFSEVPSANANIIYDGYVTLAALEEDHMVNGDGSESDDDATQVHPTPAPLTIATPDAGAPTATAASQPRQQNFTIVTLRGRKRKLELTRDERKEEHRRHCARLKQRTVPKRGTITALFVKKNVNDID